MKPTLAAASLFAVLLVSAAHAEPQVFDCVAEPAQRVAIGSPVTGLLASVRVGRGDEVKRGDELARLESTVEEANVSLATAQANARESLESQRTRLELAEANLERSLKLLNSGAVTQSKIDELQAIVAIARRDLVTEELRLRLAAIELDRQKSLLARQSIKSPVDGVVVEQSLRAGEFVRQDSAIMTIAQTDPLHVEAYVPTTLWGKIVKGSRGTVSLDHPANTRIEAEVTVVDRIFDAASGTFSIRLALPNADASIPAGQRCKVSFDTTVAGQ
ncbi:RND family efflux transporter MFP subunit [Aminobacter aminovorans]|uniref:Cation efflux system protein CusB n=1 Tax=Aminobacter aminovorans TaxID=83263 RepID=A0A381IKW5_AMIAI|nr:efflux RND transporter periplasmic adaptor subunit [Aminobacter aminovorans]TCS24880.1 RND family efflux transporter MFP subunit [Aminobacter aminovorans]SUY28054.1 Cation efflux system protein CusB precursor [Aminobacter aminovorans]